MHTQSEVLVPCRFVPPVLSRRPQNIFIFTIIINITIINKSLSSTLKCVIYLLPHTLALGFLLGSPVLSVSLATRSILELEAAISLVFCNILEFGPFIFHPCWAFNLGCSPRFSSQTPSLKTWRAKVWAKKKWKNKKLFPPLFLKMKNPGTKD